MYSLIDIFTILNLPTSPPAGRILSFLWTPFSTLYLFKNHFLSYTHPIFQTWNLRVFPSPPFPNLHPTQSITMSRQCYLLNLTPFCLSPWPALWSELPSSPQLSAPVSFAHPGVFIYRAGGGETSTCPGLERMKKHLLREQFSTGSRMLETLKLCRWNVEFL